MGQNSNQKNEELGMVGATPSQIKAARSDQSSQGQSADTNLVNEEQVRTAAEEKNIPYVNLSNFKINQKVLRLIPEDIARELRAVPYLKIGPQIRVAIDQLALLEEARQKLSQLLAEEKLKPLMVLASQKSIDQGLEQYQREEPKNKEGVAKKEIGNLPAEPSQKRIEIKEEPEKKSGLKELETKLEESPTTEKLQTLLAEAVKNRASDVHIVPQEAYARVRYRIDGVLHDVAKLVSTDYKKVLSRIKYHAKIRLNVTTRPQDGRFELEVTNKKIDIRVSTFPSIYGETIVMRLLEEEKEFYQLEELGFNKEVLDKIRQGMAKPNGMIMNTGPTGSGKTTTLYAILDKLNRPEVKIITLEDPIEYHLQGITQTQIDPEHKFPFSIGLKYALRQDPDIIMVGEIRDKITARTALHASLTGHLLLTTFHTNSAAATFIRLLDMGIRPFLLVDSINVTMAQRLVRKLCPKCKEEYKPTEDQVNTLRHLAQNDKLKVDRLYRKKGCPACNSTGYKGRIAIAEAIVPSKKVERAILKKPTQGEIEEIVREEGTSSMAQDGVNKVIEGTTSLEELLRVVAE